MDRWEYLLIRVDRADAGGPRYVVDPRQPSVENHLDNVGPSHTVALLDELGQDGWELVTVDIAADTYWLKKRVAEPATVPSTVRGLR